MGLDTAKRILMRLAVDAPVHAVLLYGSEGSGKSMLADLLAQAWLCRNPSGEGACGECQACAAVDRGRCADFQRIVPQGPSSLIGLPAIREPKSGQKPLEGVIPIQTFFRTPPLASRARVVVMEDADRLTSDAANALLKTLEEPHPYARLILTTRTPGAVLPTVLSRCLAVACELPPATELAGSEERLALILADGAPGHAFAMREKPEPYRKLFGLAERIAKATPAEALALGESFRGVAESFAEGDGVRASNVECLRLLALFLSRQEPPMAQAVLDVLEAHRRILGNANAGIVLDALFARLTLAGEPNG